MKNALKSILVFMAVAGTVDLIDKQLRKWQRQNSAARELAGFEHHLRSSKDIKTAFYDVLHRMQSNEDFPLTWAIKSSVEEKYILAYLEYLPSWQDTSKPLLIHVRIRFDADNTGVDVLVRAEPLSPINDIGLEQIRKGTERLFRQALGID